jgi:hypothetical protein
MQRSSTGVGAAPAPVPVMSPSEIFRGRPDAADAPQAPLERLVDGGRAAG